MEKPTNRRALLGIVSGVAAVMAACGKTDFSAKTITQKAEPLPPIETPPPEYNPNTVETPPPTALPNEADFCGLNKTVLGKTSDIPAELNLIFNSVLYGDKTGVTMLAIKFNSAAPGSEVILSVASADGSSIIARRLATGAGVVFDNLNLSGFDKIDVLIVSGASKRRQEVTTKDADYQKVYDGRPVIQPWSGGASQSDYFANTFKGRIYPANVDTVTTPRAKQMLGAVLDRHLQTSGWTDQFDIGIIFTDIFGTVVTSPAAVLASNNIFVAYAPVTVLAVPKYVRQIFTFG